MKHYNVTVQAVCHFSIEVEAQDIQDASHAAVAVANEVKLVPEVYDLNVLKVEEL